LGDFNFNSTYQIAFSQDDGASWMPPELTRITGVAGGAGCSVYITRQVASDAFVAKLAPDGATLWATFLGGSDEDAPVALTLDALGKCLRHRQHDLSGFPVVGSANRRAGPTLGLPHEGFAGWKSRLFRHSRRRFH
jgi:hypothetical protein